MKTIETYSTGETFALGRQIGQQAEAGEIYTLIGDLGVGKTVLTQGVAAGLGIEEPVNSPTFTIVQIYEEGRMPFYHFDVYRIGDVEEMEEVGYEDCFYGEGVCLIEWADLIEEILPREHRRITIDSFHSYCCQLSLSSLPRGSSLLHVGKQQHALALQ